MKRTSITLREWYSNLTEEDKTVVGYLIDCAYQKGLKDKENEKDDKRIKLMEALVCSTV